MSLMTLSAGRLCKGVFSQTDVSLLETLLTWKWLFNKKQSIYNLNILIFDTRWNPEEPWGTFHILKKNACVLRVNTASVSCLVQTQNRTRTLCRLVWNKPVVQPSRGNECVDQRHLCNSHAQPLLPSGGDQEDEPHLPAVAQGSSWCSVRWRCTTESTPTATDCVLI